jgi:hypothetical protein
MVVVAVDQRDVERLPPTMTTRGAGSIRASFMVRSVPFHRHCYSRGFAEQGSIAYVLHTQRL